MRSEPHGLMFCISEHTLTILQRLRPSVAIRLCGPSTLQPMRIPYPNANATGCLVASVLSDIDSDLVAPKSLSSPDGMC